MATVVAQSNFIFGLRKGVTNNLCFLDDQTVVFPSGNNCIRYNIDQKWQKFIPGMFVFLKGAKHHPKYLMIKGKYNTNVCT